VRSAKTSTQVFEDAAARRGSSGQFIVGAVALLCVLMIIVQAMVWYMQQESTWTQKSAKETTAFYLAETGVNRANFQLLQNGAYTTTIMNGSALNGYNFDAVYSDVSGGEYAIKISSTSGSTLVVEAVGRDLMKRQIRAIKATYTGASGGLTNTAMYSVGIASVSGATVNWGPIQSLSSIYTNNTYPRMYSAQDISYDTNGPTPPNTDGVLWWSYYSGIQPSPAVNLAYYKALATSEGAGHVIDACTYTNDDLVLGTVVGDYYITADGACVPSMGKTSFITGSLVSEVGLTSTKAASIGQGSYVTSVPPYAWKEYGHSATEWTLYKTWDTSAPASYAAAVSANYVATGVTTTLSNVLVHGFTYVGGAMTFASGATVNFHGVLVVGGTATLTNSNVSFYYDPTTTVQTSSSGTSLSQASWSETASCSWTGTYPFCSN
jgi:Tfp pilus assembly protein PilX